MTLLYEALVAVCLFGHPCEQVTDENKYDDLSVCMAVAIERSFNLFVEAKAAGAEIESILISCFKTGEEES